jgi:Leucine-rich repeat (LRR) protein
MILSFHIREELPATIGNLQSLIVLDVEGNLLSGTCLVQPVLRLTHLAALPRTMSQLQALQKLHVGRNQLQYSDVEFIIENFPQLTELGISGLALTGRLRISQKSHQLTRLSTNIRCLRM